MKENENFNKDFESDEQNQNIDDMLNDAFAFMNDEVYDEDYENEDDDFGIDEDDESQYFVEEGDEEELKSEKKKKVIYSVLIGVLSLLIIVISVVLIKFSGMLGKIDVDDGSPVTNEEGETLADEEDFDTMYDVSDATSLNDSLKKWANNGGQIMSSKNVINVLLIGEDGDGSKTSNGRSDSIIIASINRKAQTITLSSIMRDSYIYFNVNGADKYERINATNFYGGPKALVKAVESNYKVKIDYYASVYFGSFKGVIDALGGVTVPIEPGFAAYINRTTSSTVTSGDAVKLNGKKALIYCRIRHYYTDSDVSRTKNQRRVINAMIQSAKGASVKQLYNAVNSVLPYLKTDISKSKIIYFGKKALTDKWMDYELQQETYPTLEARATASINGQSVWVVDYPLAAQTLQKMIYGKTNIDLSPNRTSVLSLYLSQRPTTNYNNNGNTNQVTQIATNETTTATGNEYITQAPVENSTGVQEEPSSEPVSQETPTESTGGGEDDMVIDIVN